MKGYRDKRREARVLEVLRCEMFPGGHPESSPDYFHADPIPSLFNGWASSCPGRRTGRGIEAADLFEMLSMLIGEDR